ncbi:MAG: hypothetical protein QXP43_01980 [Nitrososphaerota archaeon]
MRSLLVPVLVLALTIAALSIPSHAARLPQSDSLSVVDWYWGSPGVKVDAGPGDERMPLTVVLINTRKEAVFGVAAELRLSGPFRSSDGSATPVAYSPAPARSGDAVYLTFELDVSPDASPGTYDLEVLVRYNYVDKNGDVASSTFTEPIELELKANPGMPELLDVDWASGVPPEYGSLGRLTVSLAFRERLPINRLSAELELPDGLRGPDGGAVVTSVAGPAAGTVYALGFDLVPQRDAPTRAKATLRVEYVLEWGTKRRFDYPIEIPLRGRPGIEVRVEPRTLIAGTVNPLRLEVGNAGTEALRGVTLSISTAPGSPLTLLKGSRVELQSIGVGELVVLEGLVEVYASPGATEGPVTLTLRAEYFDSSGTRRVEVLDVGLALTRPVRNGFELDLGGNALTLGREGELSFRLRNVSGGEVSDVEVVVSAAPPLTLLSSGIFRADAVPADGVLEFKARVIPSPTASEGVYRVAVTVTYKDRYGRVLTESREVGVLVKGLVSLKVFNLDVLTEDPASRLFSVTGDLLNEGLTTSRTVWVELRGDDVASSTPSYLGDVQPGEQKSFSVEGRLRGDSGRVLLVFTYRDRFGEVSEYSVPVSVKIEGSAARFETTQTTTVTARTSSELSYAFGIAGWAAFIISLAYLLLVARRRGGHGRGPETADQA